MMRMFLIKLMHVKGCKICLILATSKVSKILHWKEFSKEGLVDVVNATSLQKTSLNGQLQK